MGQRPRPRVLLADDYPALITALTRLLTPSCDVVGHAADGAALLEAFADVRPDVVVVDVNLPGLNGLEVCSRIRASTRNAAVVVISATTDPAIQERALAVGATAFVSKYELAGKLEDAVKRAFDGTSA